MRQQQAARDDAPTSSRRHQQILAFLENEIGLAALKRHELSEAARRFEAAIALDPRNAPGYLNLGDVRLIEGRHVRGDRRMGAARRDLAGSGVPDILAARERLRQLGDVSPLPDPLLAA